LNFEAVAFLVLLRDPTAGDETSGKSKAKAAADGISRPLERLIIIGVANKGLRKNLGEKTAFLELSAHSKGLSSDF
jgi:hypothetical protein